MSWHKGLWPLASDPYAVQIAAMERGADKYKFGYFMEQGLAKTAVDFACFLYDLQNDLVDAHVVIAPSYLKSGWEDEAAKWKVGVPVFTWPDRVSEEYVAKRKPFIFVLDAENVLYTGGRYLRDLIASGIRLSVTLDECSFIKNMNGTVSKATRELCSPVEVRRGLCGTPMTQNVLDWYPQLRFLGEINGWNPYQFRNRFAVMSGFKGKQVKGVRNEEELHTILDRCSFRALKRDWWKDMPEKIPLLREFEMVPKQRDAYRTMLNDFYYEVAEDDAVFANQVIHMKLKLQQISRGFLLDKDNDRVVEIFAKPNENPAIKVTKQIIEDTPGKLIIATHYRHSTDLLEEQLQKYGVVVMRGGMTKDEIKDVKLRFNEDRAIKVIIGLDAVIARGHTLLGTVDDRCSTTVFFENSYNKEIRDQLEDRNHRWGQDRAVNYIDLFCCQEDKAVLLALQAKQDLIEAVTNAVRAYPKL